MAEESEKSLTDSISALQAELTTLNQHRFFRVHNSYWRMIGYQFVRGLAMGLGTVVGATVLVSLMVYFLSQIELVPIVGEWAKQIAEEIRIGQ